MTRIEFAAFTVGEHAVVTANIKPMPFVAFVGLMTEARTMPGASLETSIRRLRLIRQVDYIDAAGKAVPMDVTSLMKLPISPARKINAELDKLNGPAGKIVRDGDGISTIIGYELGTPITVAGTDKTSITELEFLAQTYGDVESMLNADDAFSQTAALLETVAKPVHKTMTSMPSWAINMISISDGVTLAQKVLPRFLEDSPKDT